MPNLLHDLTVDEVSLVDRPANSEINPKTGHKIERARVVLYKRDAEDDVLLAAVEGIGKAEEGKLEQDGKRYPKSDFAYAPDDVPTHTGSREESAGRSPGRECRDSDRRTAFPRRHLLAATRS